MTTTPLGPRPRAVAVDNDIYTVLLLVSFLFLLAATVYVAYRAVTMFGGVLPPGGG